MNVGVVILAAGGSTRLGSPKQLLDFRGRTLLRHAAETALATACRPVVVVLGAEAARLKVELAGLEVNVVENPAWERGIGGSVRCGVGRSRRLAEGLDGVLLMLSDQPLVRAEGLEALVQAFERGGPLCQGAAAAYGGTVGVPAVFGQGLFDAMETLPEEAGAKALLRRPGAGIVAVAMPEAATDVDTRAEYERLIGG